MAFGSNYFASALLLAATFFLLLVCISSPIVQQISFINIHRTGTSLDVLKASFGIFGYCLNGICKPVQLGYRKAYLPSTANSNGFLIVDEKIKGLSKGLILHPIAAGISLLSFLSVLFNNSLHLGNILPTLIALLAFLTTLAALILDFILFGQIKTNIATETDPHVIVAKYGNAVWLTLVSVLMLFFAGIAVCCVGSSNRRRERERTRGGSQGGRRWYPGTEWLPRYEAGEGPPKYEEGEEVEMGDVVR